MFCKRCNFPLHDLKHSTCPECGQSFDPLNPHSYADRPTGIIARGWRWVLVCVMAAWALFVSWSPWIAWFVAWIQVGSMPAPYMPEPNGALWGLHILAAVCGIGGLLPMGVMSWIAFVAASQRRSDSRAAQLFQWTMTLLALSVASLALSLLWIGSTPWPVQSWWSST